MDLWQFIAADHDNADELFRETLGSFEGGVESRGKLFGQLKLALEQHIRMEEAVFYPALQRYDGLRVIIGEAIEEHRRIKESLQELGTGDKDGAEWTARFKELRQLVEHHVREEEERMFPAAQQAIDPGEAQSLLERMEQAKLDMMRSAG